MLYKKYPDVPPVYTQSWLWAVIFFCVALWNLIHWQTPGLFFYCSLITHVTLRRFDYESSERGASNLNNLKRFFSQN